MSKHDTLSLIDSASRVTWALAFWCLDVSSPPHIEKRPALQCPSVPAAQLLLLPVRIRCRRCSQPDDQFPCRLFCLCPVMDVFWQAYTRRHRPARANRFCSSRFIPFDFHSSGPFGSAVGFFPRRSVVHVKGGKFEVASIAPLSSKRRKRDESRPIWDERRESKGSTRRTSLSSLVRDARMRGERGGVAATHEREKRFYTLNGADKLYHMAFMLFALLLLVVLYRFTLVDFDSHRCSSAVEMRVCACLVRDVSRPATLRPGSNGL